MSKHCDICNLDFIDEYAFHGHLMGKKHKKNEEYDINKKRQERNSIYISLIPSKIKRPPLIKFFTQFGKIQSCKFGYEYIIIEYENSEPVDFLLKTPVYFGQWKLNIHKRIVDFRKKQKLHLNNSPKEQDTNTDNKNEKLMERIKFKFELESETSWDAQLINFLSHVQNDDALIEERSNEVCQSLNLMLKHFFPNGKAMRFGSTVTGLHLKHSDVDIFYDIGEAVYDQQKPHDRKKWTQKAIFKKVKNELFINKSIFSLVVPIPLAKTPVIKCHHISTNTDCDITFKHRLGVDNSELIKYYLSLDTRLRPLMIIIKYWAKSHELSGSGKITNYSLVMAVIFYLQQPHVNLLPTVKELQSSCEPVYSCGWLVSFNKNITPHNANNDSSIPQLLHGFFKFYHEFNFSLNCICPLDGLVVPKVDFVTKMINLGINMEAFNLNKPVCIQDPFQLDHNISEGWALKITQKFQQYCLDGVQLCELEAKNNYLSLLSSIYDPIQKHQSKIPISIYIPILAGKFEKFGLSEDIDGNTSDENQKIIENNWFKVVYQLVEKIFTKIYKFELQMAHDGIDMKQMKVEENSDVHTKANNTIVFICHGNYCMSRSRRNKIPLLDENMSCIERQTIISDKILAEQKEKKQEVAINFICTLEKKTNPLQVLMTLTDEQHTNKIFREIGSHIRCKIPSIIDAELSHMVQHDKQL